MEKREKDSDWNLEVFFFKIAGRDCDASVGKDSFERKKTQENKAKAKNEEREREMQRRCII